MLAVALVLTFFLGVTTQTAAGQASGSADPRAPIKKVSRQMVWEPGPDGKQIPLWPDNLSIEKPASGDRAEEVGNGSRLVAGRPWHWASYVTRPTMTIYAPKGGNSGAAILVLPGGGYEAVAMDLEGTEICDWVTRQRMTCVILKYRVPQTWRHNGVYQPPKVQLPLQDAQRAMHLLRHNASAYGIDAKKIGVIGFSAGAHLAGAISNAGKLTYEPVDLADRQAARPDFAVLLYPGRFWDEGSTRAGLELSPWVDISRTAPPTLLIHSMTDPTNDVRHSIAYGLALRRAGVPVEMHLYPGGGHAFGIRPTNDAVTTEWPGLVERWLRSLKVL